MRRRLSAVLAGLLAAGVGSGGATAAPTPTGPAVQAAEARDAGSARVTSNPPPRLSGAAEAKNAAAGVVAPKGEVPSKGGTSSAAGAAPATSGAPALAAPVYYLYNNAIQTPPANTFDGGAANFVVVKPWKKNTDYHTLVEMGIQDPSQRQTVEIGITVDPVVNGGSSDPHLFVFHWVNGVPACYNGCGWVDWPDNPIGAGSNLASAIGLSKQLLMQYYNGAWWFAYDGQWIGYYPDSLWTGASPPATFTKVGHAKLFGEVAAATPTPCTDMGNGYPGTAANHATSATPASRIGSWSLIPSNGTNVLSGPVSTPTTIPGYAYVSTALSVRTFVLGGPGWNAAGTGAGTRNAC